MDFCLSTFRTSVSVQFVRFSSLSVSVRDLQLKPYCRQLEAKNGIFPYATHYRYASSKPTTYGNNILVHRFLNDKE
jgi:hypothetical protein